MKHKNTAAPKEAFIAFLKELVQESDRAAIVLGSSKIEHLLGELIKARLAPLEEGKKDELVDRGGPLSNFSSRIKAAKRLGLIDQGFVHVLIKFFNPLRNRIVHNFSMSLEDQEQASDVRNLSKEYKDLPIYKDGMKAVQQQNPNLSDIGAMLRVTLALMIARLERACQDTEPLQPSTTFSLTSEHWLAK